MQKILEVKNLKKNYGSLQAVKGVSFDISENEIFGLVGPNGAGKSTVLKMIATILSISDGEVFVCGEDLKKHSDKIRRMISYLPEEAGAYKNLTGEDYLRFMSAIYTDDFKKQKDFFEFGKEISNLGSRLKDKAKTYSKGMTRKLMLARAVMSRPKLAILDEPTSGLDVINGFEIRKTIKKLASEGMAVLLSSHNMLEVEFLSERVAMIDRGEIKADGSPAQLKNQYNAQNLEEVFIKIANY